MKKGNHRIGSKQFFTMSVLAVSVLGLIIVTSAAQKPTNTHSDASGSSYSCSRNPDISLVGNPVGKRQGVEYTLKITNNDKHNPEVKDHCSGDGYVIRTVLPRGWNSTIQSRRNTKFVFLNEGETENVSVTVTPSNNAENDNYEISVKVINYEQNNDTADASISLNYKVTGNKNNNTGSGTKNTGNTGSNNSSL